MLSWTLGQGRIGTHDTLTLRDVFVHIGAGLGDGDRLLLFFLSSKCIAGLLFRIFSEEVRDGAGVLALHVATSSQTLAERFL